MTDWDCSHTERHSYVVNAHGSHKRRADLDRLPALSTASDPSCDRLSDVAWHKDETNADSGLQSPENIDDCNHTTHTA